MKSRLFPAMRALVSIALMAGLIYATRGSIPSMVATLKGLPLHFFLLGYAMFAAAAVIASARLRLLLTAQNIFLSIGNMVRLTFVGYFFSSFLPTSVGGDVVKAFYISKATGKMVQSYASVFIDRFLGMCSIFIIAATALFCSADMPRLYFNWLLPALLVGSAAFLILLMNRRTAKAASFFFTPFLPAALEEKFKTVYEALHRYKDHKAKVAACLALSLAAQAIAFSAVAVFGMGLSFSVPLKFILLTMAAASIAGMVPSVYGTGPRETAMVLIMAPLVGEEKALAAAFLWLGVLLATSLIGGAIYIVMGWYKVRPVDLPA